MVAAYVLINITMSDPMEVLASLRAVAGVKQAHILLGPTDAIVYIECANHDELRETLLAIRAVQVVEDTDTRYVYQ